MKTISLSIIERLQLLGFLNSFQGKTYETLTEVWKLIEKIKITEDEKKVLNFKASENSAQWEASKETPFEVNLTSDEEKAFVDDFKEKSDKKQLGSEIYNVAQVYNRLKQLP